MSSCSQILLKKSAQKEHTSRISEMVNVRVVLAYSVFLLSVIINVIALGHGVNVKDLPILEALGYIFVPILSYIFIKEKITKRCATAILMILGGIIIFYL